MTEAKAIKTIRKAVERAKLAKEPIPDIVQAAALAMARWLSLKLINDSLQPKIKQPPREIRNYRENWAKYGRRQGK